MLLVLQLQINCFTELNTRVCLRDHFSLQSVADTIKLLHTFTLLQIAHQQGKQFLLKFSANLWSHNTMLI